MSPGFIMGGMGNAQAVPGGDANKANFPAGMAGLLNNPVQPERTGLTPQYSGPEPNGMGAGGANVNGAASPFSQMFGTYGGGFACMDGIGTDIDWVSLSSLPFPPSSHSAGFGTDDLCRAPGTATSKARARRRWIRV